MATLYLLDTNMVIYIQRGVPSVLARLNELGAERVALSSIVVAELAYGVEKSLHKTRNRKVLELFLSEVRVLPWTQEAMWHYAQHNHALRTSGQRIGEMDLLIGCHALALDAVCVTNNTREFECIDGLKLENWAQPGAAA
ncbi:MAG: type II toxin-antitoxin system VapC family toxin [Hydrogenophaga sp.]|jgi:tRNA(fMet)-specific endonuclease VapC|nr:type II toxin-antitoxin system VapC family toxin [Hydrogenophaga sp.]